MLEFLFGRKNAPNIAEDLDIVLDKLIAKYPIEDIEEKRKDELGRMLRMHGYINYSFYRAQKELSFNEVMYALIYKFKQNGVYKGGKLEFENKNISPLARCNADNPSWLYREGHNIKLINLAALGNSENEEETGKFFDWLIQLVILPTGSKDNNIFSTTIYLVPFHPRDFGCAYLPRSSDVSDALYDAEIEHLTGLDKKSQVKTFIQFCQLAGHPVIYDILPQTGRFSKEVLANPEIARWFDVNALQGTINAQINLIAEHLYEKFDKEDVELIKDIYLQNSGSGDLSEKYKGIFDDFANELEELKIKLSNEMMTKGNQIKIQKRVKSIICELIGQKQNAKLEEKDIKEQISIVAKLINEGLWPAPGGAWCSAGCPVFDQMSDCGDYPIFKHYDYKGSDVTELANLDCQTPYYFSHLEDGTLNYPVIEYFIKHVLDIQKEYNFDGFRFDHTDHIIDKVSEKDGKPISYRLPRVVIKELNSALKKRTPYFATVAEYMLQGNSLKEYHQEMNFDLLWGDDIPHQYKKTPEKIDEDNKRLANYNVKFGEGAMLSVIKTFNNQDGEFNCIDQYPGQLGVEGALFKWFKYKFLPGGKFANRPIMYVDGDESFTQKGVEHVTSNEVSMKRGHDEEFFEKFDAIDRFVKNDDIIPDGEAQVILEDNDGFVVWMISKEPMKKSYLVVANFNNPTEKIVRNDEVGERYAIVTHGKEIHDKSFTLPGDYILKGEFFFKNGNFKLKSCENLTSTLNFDTLKPAQFKVFRIDRA